MESQFFKKALKSLAQTTAAAVLITSCSTTNSKQASEAPNPSTEGNTVKKCKMGCNSKDGCCMKEDKQKCSKNKCGKNMSEKHKCGKNKCGKNG